ncbi:MAG: helix-turn-helix transcriptional regulator [Bryobacterales bacterium]|nr:helix-turn-helix transcriptional regulator [Bryobacterales bacterium]
MIKNEKQYRITKAQARRFEESLAELEKQDRPTNIAPRLWQAQRDAAESQLRDLRDQIDAYEQLHMGKDDELLLEAVEDLPKTLIRARIAAGMTQEGLAHRLGVKTQQVQRYEATDYESASFARIRKVVEALGLRLPTPARLTHIGRQSRC